MITQLDQGLPTLDHRKKNGPRGLNEPSQPIIGGVAAGHQDNLGRRPVTFEQFNEVGVLQHDDGASPTGGHEDVDVRRALKMQIADGHTLDRKRPGHPLGQPWWELVIEPDCHAATIG